jgi:hypothetical protein
MQSHFAEAAKKKNLNEKEYTKFGFFQTVV